MTTQYVLAYWPARGLSERIRLILEYVGAKYTDVNYTDRAEWFEKVKPQFLNHNPLANLPYLKDGETIISQTSAIIAYIALKHKPELLGRSVEEAVDAAQVRGALADFHSAYVGLVYGSNFETKKAGFVVNAKHHLERLSKFLGKRQYYAGGITAVDFVSAEFLDVLNAMEPGILDHYENLNDHTKRIFNLPEIKNYKETRFVARPYNGPSAHWK